MKLQRYREYSQSVVIFHSVTNLLLGVGIGSAYQKVKFDFMGLSIPDDNKCRYQFYRHVYKSDDKLATRFALSMDSFKLNSE